MDSIISKKHGNWKGGKSWVSNVGYKIIYLQGHPKGRGNRVQEHRWIMEQHLGRYLKSSEIIHHINGNKLDNRIENLQLTTRVQHPSNHKRVDPDRKCSKCGRKTYLRSNGVQDWYKLKDGFECKKCHRIYLGSIGVPHNKR